ncbi:MAG: HAD-IIA family hydrolase [Halobacteriaceae archaeon]
MTDFDAAIVDLDGTVYRGHELIPGADEAVDALRAAGLDLLFLTNNPTRSAAEFADDLADLGLSVSPGEILTSGEVTAEYLADHHPDARVHAVAEHGLTDQLEGAVLTRDPEEADVLLGSIDRAFSYGHLIDALRAVESGVEAFVGTDPDRTIPTGDGSAVPGSGAIVGAIEATTGRGPDAVLGKPSPETARAARERLGDPDPERVLVVGDRLDTDVALGERAGMVTALVLSGVTRRAEVADAAVSPDHVLDSLGAVPDLL